MNREEAREAAKVMLHYANGGEVTEEPRWETGPPSVQRDCSFDWGFYKYRKAPPKPVKKYVGVYLKNGEYLCTPAFDYPPGGIGNRMIKVIEVEEEEEDG